MRNFFLVSLFIILCDFDLQASKSVISGQIPGAENNEIRLLTFAELITYSTVILDRTNIDSLGFFSLETDISETSYCILDLDYFASGIYIEPGAHYKIEADTIDEISPFKPFYNKSELIYYFDSLEKDDLNNLIDEFNIQFDDFILENFESIYNRRNRALVDIFRKEVHRKYIDINNDYFQNYMVYKIASVELAAAPVVKPQLFDTYFKDKQIRYNHIEYMHFFNQFFDQYLLQQSKTISEDDLISTINHQNKYSALLDTLGKDTLLRNEVFRELVLIKNLVSLYNNPEFSKKNIISILDQLINNTVFKPHRQIAQNCIKEITKLEQGTLAPQFILPDLNDRMVSLSDFEGKPVYLSFLTTWSHACLGEYKLLDNLYKKYGDKINFITVSLDKNPEIVDQFIADKEYGWLFLYNGSNYNLINSYEIKTFPLFVLIDENGFIIQYPAYKPSEIIEEEFKHIIEVIRRDR